MSGTSGAMLIFFDTEFSDLGLDPRLISLGAVSQDGRHGFYAELSDGYMAAQCSAFTQLAVLPQLDGGAAAMTSHELSLRFGNWLEGFDRPVALATDSLAWDWPWVHEIFAEPGTWPENLARRPVLLDVNHLRDADLFFAHVEQAFLKEKLRLHHALDDAQANRLGWLASGGSFEGWRE